METTTTGYKPLDPGARVTFLRRGKLSLGYVTARHLDPNRKPGIGRVSYDVRTDFAHYPVRIEAKRILTAEPMTEAEARASLRAALGDAS